MQPLHTPLCHPFSITISAYLNLQVTIHLNIPPFYFVYFSSIIQFFCVTVHSKCPFCIVVPFAVIVPPPAPPPHLHCFLRSVSHIFLVYCIFAEINKNIYNRQPSVLPAKYFASFMLSIEFPVTA